MFFMTCFWVLQLSGQRIYLLSRPVTFPSAGFFPIAGCDLQQIYLLCCGADRTPGRYNVTRPQTESAKQPHAHLKIASESMGHSLCICTLRPLQPECRPPTAVARLHDIEAVHGSIGAQHDGRGTTGICERQVLQWRRKGGASHPPGAQPLQCMVDHVHLVLQVITAFRTACGLTAQPKYKPALPAIVLAASSASFASFEDTAS